MRSKLRAAGVKVSKTTRRVKARLELIVEVDGNVVRVPVPASYLLVAPADSMAIAHLIERDS